MANSAVTVILKGHCVKTGTSPRRSRRNVNQCDTPVKIVAKMPSRTRKVPKRICPLVQANALRGRRMFAERTEEPDHAEAEARHGERGSQPGEGSPVQG